MFRRPLTTFVAVAAVLVPLLVPVVSQAQAVPCGLPNAAFCDTFDAPSPNGAGTRSGDLDGVVWGVSRATSDDNGSSNLYTWKTTQLNRCGTSVSVGPSRDVQICNGQLVESLNDGGSFALLAMYPRQPFDFSGRTGKIVFDVGNDTQGTHMAWPEIVITDQPVPAPHNDAAGVNDFARNSVGISMAAVCQGNTTVGAFGDSWSVDSMFTTANYTFNTQTFNRVACVKKPTAFGQLNHVEVRISASHVEVWATDAGATTLKLIASADISMPLTRGLPWIEDVHYNANKIPGTQADHTFVWDNFGFDGPVLARDLGFDVLDATHDGASGGNLGYLVPSGRSLTLQIPGVHSLANASAALLEFTWWPHLLDSITYTLNGHAAHTMAWPYGANAPTFKSYTLAVPVPLAELQDGTNAVMFSSTDTILGGVSIANIDLILVGAGGGGGVIPPGSATPTNTPGPSTATPTQTPTPNPGATSSPTATPQRSNLSPTPTSTADSQGNPTPTSTATSSNMPTPTNIPLPPSGDGAAPPGGGGPGAPAGAGPGAPAGGTVISAPAPVPQAAGQQTAAEFASKPAEAVNPAITALQPPTVAAAIVGELAPDGAALSLGNLSLTLPGASTTFVVDLVQTDPDGLAAKPDGFLTGDATFQVILNDPATHQLVQAPTAPITLSYLPTAHDLALAGGDAERLRLAWWDGASWQALSCQAGDSLICTAPWPGIFSVVAAPAPIGPLDFDTPGGRLFKETNGYSGAGSTGFAVVDDADAPLWTEFQRLGGLERVGYPIGNRFVYHGFLTQAFQKLVLQWRPELELAVAVNVFDELDQHGSNGWLERARQVPVGFADPHDAGAAWEDVVARHVELLAAYPTLYDFYTSDPDAVDTYGLPVAVQDYGGFVAVRLQRATLQLWPADTVTIGNGGDMAKDAGLWPSSVTSPAFVTWP